jgi:hypothetical protein
VDRRCGVAAHEVFAFRKSRSKVGLLSSYTPALEEGLENLRCPYREPVRSLLLVLTPFQNGALYGKQRNWPECPK